MFFITEKVKKTISSEVIGNSNDETNFPQGPLSQSSGFKPTTT